MTLQCVFLEMGHVKENYQFDTSSVTDLSP